MTITMKCSHKFCPYCNKTYVDEQVQSSKVPVKCPSLKCRYYSSTSELKSFLPVASYALLEGAISAPTLQAMDKFYWPFSDCAVLCEMQSHLAVVPPTTRQGQQCAGMSSVTFVGLNTKRVNRRANACYWIVAVSAMVDPRCGFILGINLDDQTVIANGPMVSNCENRVQNSSQTASIDLGIPFLFSKSHNKLVVGCGNGVIMERGSALTGCSTACINDTVGDKKNFLGFCCCKTPIANYLKSYSVNLRVLERRAGDGGCRCSVIENYFVVNMEGTDLVLLIERKFQIFRGEVMRYWVQSIAEE
ncbi:putative wall-associated receptor kinase [Tanacetum coccineum]